MTNAENMQPVVFAKKSYSIAEAVAMSGISRSGFYALLKAEKGPKSFHLGKRHLISVSAFDAWMASLERGEAAA